MERRGTARRRWRDDIPEDAEGDQEDGVRERRQDGDRGDHVRRRSPGTSIEAERRLFIFGRGERVWERKGEIVGAFKRQDCETSY